jgi:hypothetical protein
MAIKTANPELQKRITRAASMIGRGVNQANPTVELEGRRQSALAHIENQILLGRHLLTSDERAVLARLLFEDADDDYTADATTTNAEALQATSIRNHPLQAISTSTSTSTSCLEEDEDDIA